MTPCSEALNCALDRDTDMSTYTEDAHVVVRRFLFTTSSQIFNHIIHHLFSTSQLLDNFHFGLLLSLLTTFHHCFPIWAFFTTLADFSPLFAHMSSYGHSSQRYPLFLTTFHHVYVLIITFIHSLTFRHVFSNLSSLFDNLKLLLPLSITLRFLPIFHLFSHYSQFSQFVTYVHHIWPMCIIFAFCFSIVTTLAHLW